jgi:hypothetical protein
MSDGTTIAAKLAAAVSEVDRIGKDGTNEFHNYSYTSAEQVYRVVRGPLLEQGLVVIPSVAESTTSGQTTITKLHLRLIDTETGEEIEAFWMGEGQDKQDKGPYKAATGGMKTWLKHLFMLPADDDPEADHHTDSAAQRTPTKLDHLGGLLKEHGFSEEDKAGIKKWLVEEPKLKAERVDDAVALLERGETDALRVCAGFDGEVV